MSADTPKRAAPPHWHMDIRPAELLHLKCPMEESLHAINYIYDNRWEVSRSGPKYVGGIQYDTSVYEALARRELMFCEQPDVDWPRHADGYRFQFRELNGEFQVHGHGLKHVAMCTTEEMAELLSDLLNHAIP